MTFPHSISCLRPASPRRLPLAAQRPLAARGCALIAILLGCATTVPVVYADPAATRDVYKQFVEIRKLIGQESAAWREEKVTLEDSITLLETEISQLKESIDRLKNSASTADQRRDELRARVSAAASVNDKYSGLISDYEARTRQLIARLPDPLRRNIATLIAALPARGDVSRSYSQRLLILASLYSQIDRFNSDVRLVTEIKTLPSGSYEVKTLYFGLGAALFSNPDGTYAGYGAPSADGWAWTAVEGADALQIRRAISVYENTVEPAFVSVPIKID